MKVVLAAPTVGESIPAALAGIPGVELAAPPLEEAGVVLTSAVGIHGPLVAEHVLALLLASTRGVGRAQLQRPQRAWSRPPVCEIGGTTMAVLGLGVLGEAVAERARALGMRATGTNGTSAATEATPEIYPPDQTIDVLERADVAVISLPGAEETRRRWGRPNWLARRGLADQRRAGFGG